MAPMIPLIRSNVVYRELLTQGKGSYMPAVNITFQGVRERPQSYQDAQPESTDRPHEASSGRESTSALEVGRRRISRCWSWLVVSRQHRKREV